MPVLFVFFFTSLHGSLVVSGKVMHSMTAHMDAVTGLAVDPHGLYLLSGSESAPERGGVE